MSNAPHEILRYGIATPFVIFNFEGGHSIEPSNIPRYFVSLEHDRTCTKACTFKLTIIYAPDTFSSGDPLRIDNLLVNSVRQQISYQYGYYDYFGVRHTQQQLYVGQIYTYNSNADISNGTITYTIEGTSHVAQLTEKLGEIRGTTDARKPSIYLETKIKHSTDEGFAWLYQYYDYKIDRTDMPVPIPNLGKHPVLDLIMGKANNVEKNNGNIARVGGLVQHSIAPLTNSMEQLHNIGKITDAAYDWYQRDASKTQAQKFARQMQIKLGTPFISYIDDVATSNKFGTLYYVPKTGTETNNVFHFDYGNHFRESDVLSFSVTLDGSVALAAASASENVTSSVDAEGNPVGSSYAISSINNLARNTYPTLSGFNEELFLSQKELSELMLYPFEATMTVLGQIKVSQLLDIIYVVVTINGTDVQPLTGKYQIIEINDSVSESGFTTTFKLVRYVVDEKPESYLENVVSTSWDSEAHEVQTAINSTDKRNKDQNEAESQHKNDSNIYPRLW